MADVSVAVAATVPADNVGETQPVSEGAAVGGWAVGSGEPAGRRVSWSPGDPAQLVSQALIMSATHTLRHFLEFMPDHPHKALTARRARRGLSPDHAVPIIDLQGCHHVKHAVG